ncbi:tape measure protein [Gordonia sihwensis]|uniref:tape measure protein n=1 Tax=Gordonia sihwensis TaxID=173559 RepID=UPI002417AB45|nr:tape measure protein [Gordonia sihwensis]WFN94177.1 tape measure protein [Gordonia sihwensis]WFN94238.1 tape measure protein [Gordonia sihwensis]
MAGSVIYVPVAGSFKGMGAQFAKEISGAAKRGMGVASSEMESQGRDAGRKAGAATAAGLASQQKQIERVSKQLATARSAEADAASAVRIAEQKLQEVRSNSGAKSSQVVRAEEQLAAAQRRQIAASAEAVSASGQLDRVRSGEVATASSVIRAESQLSQARVRSEDAIGKVRIAETRLTELQDSGKATKSQLMTAEEAVTRARRGAASAADQVRSSEALLKAAQDDAANSARRAAAGADESASANRRAAGSAGEVGRAYGSAHPSVQSFGTSIMSAAKRALGAAGAFAGLAGAGSVLKSGFDRLMNIQRAEIQFKNVGLTSEQTKKQMATLTEQVTGTSVSLADAAKYSAMFAQSGVQMGKPMDDAIKAFTNLSAAAQGTGIDVGRILQQVSASGKMDAGVLNQLSDAGVNAAEYLSKSTGKSVAEVRKMTSEGKISFEQLVGAINSGMGTYAQEMGQTLPAKLANMKTALASAAATALEPIIPLVTRLADALTTGFKKATPAIKLVQNALAEFGGWVKRNQEWITPLAAAIGAAATAWGVWTGAIKLWNLVTKGAMAVQAAFNAVMAANPVMLVVMAIAALVAGLVVAYKRSAAFRNVVQGAWNGIKNAALAAWNNVLKPAIDGLVAGFKWVWQAVQPVINFVKRFWQVLLFGLGPIGAIIGIIVQLVKHWDTVKTVFSTVWGVIKPILSGFLTVVKYIGAIVATVIIGTVLVAWNLLKAAVQLAWVVIQPILNLFMAGLRLLGSVATWLWQTVMMPVWNGIKAVIGFFWAGVQVVFNAFMAVMRVVATVANWLWQTVMVPVWNGIKAAAQFMWLGISTIFGWFRAGVTALGSVVQSIANAVIIPVWNALKAAAGFMWNGIRVIFDAMKKGWDLLGKGIRMVVDNVVKPAFEGFKRALAVVGDFFGSVVRGIGNAWDKIKSFVAKPINFVIGTVWNNGLLKAWNKVASFLPGLKEMSPLPEVAFRHGGPVPMSQGATRGKDSVHALMMPGEHVWDVMDVVRAGGHEVMYAMRAMIERGIPFTWGAARGLEAHPKVAGAIAQAPSAAPIGGFLHAAEIPGFKDGGAVAEAPAAWEGQLARGHAWAKAQNGKPYLAGNQFPAGADCSGYMSALASVIISGNDKGHWATPAFPAGQGDRVSAAGQPWVKGLSRGFSIGIKGGPDSGGQNGHTAGTLSAVKGFSAVNVESGGSHGNIAYGGPAVGADHPQFPGRYHLSIGSDGAFEAGGSGPSPEEQMGIIKKKISELLDKALNPIKSGMGRMIGTPPPEWLGIPPRMLDWSKKQVLDEFFKIVGGLGDKLRSVYEGAKKVKNVVTGAVKSVYDNTLGKILPFADGGAVEPGLWRDKGGYIPPGKSVVTNETGKPEAVLNWDQVELLKKLLELAQQTGKDALKETVGGVADFFGFKTISDKLYDAVESRMNQGADATDSTSQSDDAVASTRQSDDALEATEQSQDAIDSTEQSGTAYTDPTYGDPNATYQTHEEKSTTPMPDMGTSHTYQPGAGAEQWRPMAIEAIKRVGLSTAKPQVDAMISQIQSESGGDPNIAQQISDVNGTGEGAGVGLLQIIPSTFAAHRDPSLPDDRRNPMSNMVAALRYYKSRYGDDLTAQWGHGHGYDSGGWLKPGLTMAVNKTRKPEAVLTAGQWGRIDAMLEALPSAAEFKAAAAVTAAQPMRASDADMDDVPVDPRSRGQLHQHFHTEDVSDAVRKATREQRRLSRSDALVGGL